MYPTNSTLKLYVETNPSGEVPSQESSWTQPFTLNSTGKSIGSEGPATTTTSPSPPGSTNLTATNSSGTTGSTDWTNSRDKHNSPPNYALIFGGLSASLGVLLMILLILYLRTQFRWRQQEASDVLSSKQFDPPETPTTMIPEINASRGELPTAFNVPRSMTATFLSKFELPGEGNELNPCGPFELESVGDKLESRSYRIGTETVYCL